MGSNEGEKFWFFSTTWQKRSFSDGSNIHLASLAFLLNGWFRVRPRCYLLNDKVGQERSCLPDQSNDQPRGKTAFEHRISRLSHAVSAQRDGVEKCKVVKLREQLQWKNLRKHILNALPRVTRYGRFVANFYFVRREDRIKEGKWRGKLYGLFFSVRMGFQLLFLDLSEVMTFLNLMKYLWYDNFNPFHSKKYFNICNRGCFCFPNEDFWSGMTKIFELE